MKDIAEIEWISVKDRLPLEEYTDPMYGGVVGDFLAVFNDHNDPNEDAEVGYASYSTRDGWCYPDLTPHNYWKELITHWAEMPRLPLGYDND